VSTDLATRPAGADAESAAKSLRGIQKAAILLVAIGEERAGEIFRYLSDTEVEALSLEIAKSRKVDNTIARDVIGEAVETVLAEDYIAEGGVDYARSILERSLGANRAEEVIGRLAATIERRPFEFLRRTPAEQIAVFLRSESPQTIALVVANLHTTLAAQTLSMLEPEAQAEVARRIAKMAETRPEVVAQVETVMRQKLSNIVAQEYAAAGGVKSLADILNHSDRTTERNVLDELAKSESELAEEVRLLLFTFEDVVKLDDRSIQMVLKEVDQKDLAIALRGVNEDVRSRIFSNMSERGAELLKEEIDFQPPQRKRIIEEAQGRIVGVVRRLEEAGAVVISRGGGGGDDELM
jgi:flagellar motor switch protein FliG